MPEILGRNDVLAGVWELCVFVSIVILLLLLVRPVLKRLPRIGMYLLWIMVVLRIAVPFQVSDRIMSFFPGEVSQTVTEVREKIRDDWMESRLSARRMNESYGGMENAYRLPENRLPSDMFVSDTGTENISGQKGIETPAAAPEIKPEWVILTAWLFGVCCCVIYLLHSLCANRRYFRDAVHLRDNVYEHPLVCSSFVAGIFSPKIYVPVGMKEEDLECVLIHEKVHIRRWDYRIKPFAFLTFSVLWFNPLVWLAYRLMVIDMEISCDEAVIRRLGMDARKRYSYLLLTMASGENKCSATEVAFGAGVVKERIHHVMKYRKTTKWMSVFLTLAVILGGCGIASSSPAETTKELPQKRENEKDSDAIFVEQTVKWIDSDWEDSGKKLQEGTYYGTTDAQRRYVGICELMDEKGETRVSYGKKFYRDGTWHKEEISWGKKFDKVLDDKMDTLQKTDSIYLDGFSYNAAGILYISASIYRMDAADIKEGQDTVLEYKVDNLLFRIDEKTNEITELEVPAEKDSEGAEKSDEVLRNIYGFFGDGNYFVHNRTSFALYNGGTGEKIKDLEIDGEEGINQVFGEDFYIKEYLNPETNLLELHVVDEMGESSYTLPTGVKFDKTTESMDDYMLGAGGSTILLATQEGIFEAEYGDDEFHNVVNPKKDNLYYLTLGTYEPVQVYKDTDGNYFVQLWNEDNGKWVTCYYQKK